MTSCEPSSDRYKNGSFHMAISREVDAGRGAQFFLLTERSLIGDRAYALIDEKTGKLASAKNPRKWEKLFDFPSVFIDPPQVVENIPPVRITFPDGTHIFSDQDNIILCQMLLVRV